MEKKFEKRYHEIEKNHFWFKARRKYILQLLNIYPKNSSVLDIGCSSGILLNELIKIGFDSSNLFGIDISSKAIKNCKKNGVENAYVMDAQNIVLNKKFDIVIASDCLEHIKNDEDAIKNWFSLLKPNGFLYVFVPAYNVLWSNHDVANMHYRRYTKNELTKKLYCAHFKVIKSGYWNFSLFIPVLIIRFFSKIKILKNKEVNGDLYKPGLFNNILFTLINLENKVLKYISFPFGISTYCIAQKSVSKRNTKVSSVFLQYFIFLLFKLKY